jgi:hypothetical protein
VFGVSARPASYMNRLDPGLLAVPAASDTSMSSCKLNLTDAQPAVIPGTTGNHKMAITLLSRRFAGRRAD